MNWTQLLKIEMDEAYHAAEGLMDLVDESTLSWIPETGDNWMTMGQLLYHITTACGFCCRGFVTGQWVPEGVEEDSMLPPAAKMPSAESVAHAKTLLAADKALAYRMMEEAGEAELDGKLVGAPWNPEALYPLGRHLLQMVGHLSLHKAQLFYYLKLLGKPVHTGTLWGM